MEKYLLNEMTQEEKANFENKLQNDTDFKEQFQVYKETSLFLALMFSFVSSDF